MIGSVGPDFLTLAIAVAAFVLPARVALLWVAVIGLLGDVLGGGALGVFMFCAVAVTFTFHTVAAPGKNRAPRASVSGELGPSNNARLRMYLRRLRAQGAGIAPEFLELVKRALSHYGVSDSALSDALERAVLRMFSSQVEPTLDLLLVAVAGETLRSEKGLDLADKETLGVIRRTHDGIGWIGMDNAHDHRSGQTEPPRQSPLEPT